MSADYRYVAGCITGITLFLMLLPSCDRGNLPPVARLKAFPSYGDTTILFTFIADQSEDDRDYPMGLVYRWDLDGDGVWDTGFAHNKTIAQTYEQPGKYIVSVEVQDLDGLSTVAADTIEVFGMNRDIDTLYDNRDGNRYRIVKIQNRWWMAENLRYGLEIPTGREQTDNDTVEMFRKHYGSDYDTAGGVYKWLESLNYKVREPKGICPDQWHLPTKAEWDAIFATYPYLYSVIYYGKQGLSRLNLDLNNGGFIMEHEFYWGISSPWDTGFWSSSSKVEESEYLPHHVGFSSAYKEIVRGYWGNSGLDRYYSVRCIKDI